MQATTPDQPTAEEPVSDRIEPHVTFAGLSLAPSVALKRVLEKELTPDISGPWSRLANAFLSEGRLPGALREVAILRTAALTGCEYIIGPHRLIGRHLGLSAQEVLLALGPVPPDRQVDPTSPVEAVIVAVERIVAGKRVDDRDRRILKMMLGEDLLAELTMVVGQYLSISLVCAVFGLEPEQQPGSTAPKSH